MKQYNKYLISQSEQFNEENFSSLPDEIYNINEKTNKIPQIFKAEIIVSFLKDHSLNDNWIKANPELTELVISNTLFTGCIEALFESSRSNRVFQQDFENYLKGKFTGNS